MTLIRIGKSNLFVATGGYIVMYPPPNFLRGYTVYTTEHIDWLSLTFPRAFDLIKMLPSELREDGIKKIKSPIPVYETAYETALGVKILMSKYERLGIHVIISGKPLARIRAKNKYIISELYDLLLQSGGKASRVDICVNVHDSDIFTVQNALDRIVLGEHDTKLKDMKPILGKTGLAETVYVGNWKSKSRKFRIYDKAVESKSETVNKYVRIEYEKRRGANNMLNALFERKQTIKGIIKSVVNFPRWPEYQRILDCESEPLQRGEQIETDNISAMHTRFEWLANSAIPAIAKLIVDSALDYDVSIEDSPALRMLGDKLPKDIDAYIQKLIERERVY